MEKITQEKIIETRLYFKRNKEEKLVSTNNKDYSETFREYGVKTLQAYVTEIEKLRNDKGVQVEEHYFKNGSEIKLDSLLNGSGLTAMLSLLSKEIKSAEIVRTYAISTGGFVEKLDVIYKVELY